VARIRRLGLALLGFERDCSASGGIGPGGTVTIVGVGPGGTVAVGDEHVEVERPWRDVGVGERGDAADGREEWAGKCGMDPGVGGSRSRDRVVTVYLSLNAQSDRSPPSL
jgi:hypothetical protein